VHHGDCQSSAITWQEHRDEPCHFNQASYYIEEEICMFTLMVERVEDVFLSIFVRAVKHTKQKYFFKRNIYTFFPDS
jgi:Domain of unknown function (DUF4303)